MSHYVSWEGLIDEEKKKYLDRAEYYVDSGMMVGYNKLDLAKELYERSLVTK